MAEEYAVNIEPYQFELMSSESDGETILMMWTEGELVKLIGKSLFINRAAMGRARFMFYPWFFFFPSFCRWPDANFSRPDFEWRNVWCLF